MGRWLAELKKKSEPAPLETITLAEGWQQLAAGAWRGVGLLTVLEPLLYEWGSQVVIAEPGRDRKKLQQQFPKAMIFNPAEFIDAVNGWPDNAAVILAKRIFQGEIMEVVA